MSATAPAWSTCSTAPSPTASTCSPLPATPATRADPAAPVTALDGVLDLLRCPACGAALARDERTLRCPAGHAFDLAKQGYAGLLTGARATSGDDAAMAGARARFLASGAYRPLRARVADLAAATAPVEATVLDVGCGTGYYLAGVLDRLPAARGLGFDTSVASLRVAARAHPRAAAVGWDVFRPFPVADDACDVVLDVFSPRSPAEFRRVLRPDGVLLVVRPTPGHLAELRGRTPAMVAVDPAKEERLHRALDPHFLAELTEPVEFTVSLDGARAADLVGMTPSARHLDPAALHDSGAPPTTTVSVLATRYRPR